MTNPEVVFDPYQLADVIYRKLQPSIRYDPLQGWGINKSAHGFGFTTSDEEEVDGIISREVHRLYHMAQDSPNNRGRSRTHEAVGELRLYSIYSTALDGLTQIVKEAIAYPYALNRGLVYNPHSRTYSSLSSDGKHLEVMSPEDWRKIQKGMGF